MQKDALLPYKSDLIHELFDHNEDEIARAHEIIKLFEEHAACGITGFVNDQYGFIDEPIYKGALATVRRLV